MGAQCALEIENRTILYGKYEVIPLATSREILIRVVNDVVCADRAHHIQIPRAAYAGDFSPEVLGNLHREGAQAAGRTIDQNRLPLLNLSLITETLQGGESRLRYGGCFFECHIYRFEG